MSLVATAWMLPTAGTVDTAWVPSDDPLHNRIEVVESDDSITLLNNGVGTEKATYYTFAFSIPAGKVPLVIDLKVNFGYGPVAGGGDP